MRPLLSLDLETSGQLPEYALQPWRVRQKKAWVTTVAFTRRDADKLLDTRGSILQQGAHVDFDATREALRAILIKAIEMKVRIVGWNMTFDIGWFIAYDLEDLVMEIDWLDAMRLWKHLKQIPTFMPGKLSYALDKANRAFEPNYVDYKHEGQNLYHDPSPQARKRLLAYNRNDTEATLLHCERFWPQLTERQQRCALIEASCLPLVARANVTGMQVNRVAREQLANTLANVGHEIARVMAPLGVTEDIIRSPAKTGTLLYKKWQLPVIKNTYNSKGEDTGKPSTDKEVLHELAIDDERVMRLGQWREALNLRTKFMGGLLKSIEYNEGEDRTYPQATVFGTYTGRVTYSSKQGRGKSERHVGFALHQMKNDKRFRNCIVAPEGHDIAEADAAGQEFRWMAIMSGDPIMLGLCAPGEDAHSYMASQIYHEDYATVSRLNKEEHAPTVKKRKAGKVANLSLQYRTSKKRLRIAARVQYNIPMMEEEAAHIWTTYRATYEKVPDYWRSQIARGKQVGYAETLAGRRVQVEGDWTGEYKWSMESSMINHPIQGTGGDQKYLALRCLKNILNEFDAHFAWDLHDGIYFYVPKAKSKAFTYRLKHVLDNLPYKDAWGFVSPVPLPWDVKLGPAWGSLKEVEF